MVQIKRAERGKSPFVPWLLENVVEEEDAVLK
jgi:hypothetical protein